MLCNEVTKDTIMRKAINVLGISIFVLLVGVGTGILYAPASGKKTRRKLKRRWRNFGDEFSDLTHSSKEVYDDVKDSIFNMRHNSEDYIKKMLHKN